MICCTCLNGSISCEPRLPRSTWPPPSWSLRVDVPALDGQEVGNDFDESVSDDESWSAVGSPRAGDEGAKMDADTGSGGYPAGDLPKTSPRPSMARSLE